MDSSPNGEMLEKWDIPDSSEGYSNCEESSTKETSACNNTSINIEYSLYLYSQDDQQVDKDNNVLKTQINYEDDEEVDGEIEVENNIFQVSKSMFVRLCIIILRF